MNLLCKLFGHNFVRRFLGHRYLVLKCTRCEKPLSVNQKIAVFTLEAP